MMNFVQHSIKEANEKQQQKEQFVNEMEQVNPKLDELSDTQIIMMEAIAEQYEQHQAERLADMEVQATTYEAILELKKGGKV